MPNSFQRTRLQRRNIITIALGSFLALLILLGIIYTNILRSTLTKEDIATPNLPELFEVPENFTTIKPTTKTPRIPYTEPDYDSIDVDYDDEDIITTTKPPRINKQRKPLPHRFKHLEEYKPQAQALTLEKPPLQTAEPKISSSYSIYNSSTFLLLHIISNFHPIEETSSQNQTEFPQALPLIIKENSTSNFEDKNSTPGIDIEKYNSIIHPLQEKAKEKGLLTNLTLDNILQIISGSYLCIPEIGQTHTEVILFSNSACTQTIYSFCFLLALLYNLF